MSLTITHTHAAGTLIDGTGRADGSAEVLKTVVNPYTGRAGAWRWSRNLGSWYVARSRDSRANTALVDATKAALEAAGFTVAVEIDDDESGSDRNHEKWLRALLKMDGAVCISQTVADDLLDWARVWDSSRHGPAS